MVQYIPEVVQVSSPISLWQLEDISIYSTGIKS